MKQTIKTLALMLIVLRGGVASSALAADQENIQGSWTLETASMLGKTMPQPRVAVVYVFTGETMIVRGGDGNEQKSTFRLETTSKPKMLLVEHGEKPDRMPYELSGDTLKISFPSPDERPTNVSDDGQVLFTLKRTK